MPETDPPSTFTGARTKIVPCYLTSGVPAFHMHSIHSAKKSPREAFQNSSITLVKCQNQNAGTREKSAYSCQLTDPISSNDRRQWHKLVMTWGSTWEVLEGEGTKIGNCFLLILMLSQPLYWKNKLKYLQTCNCAAHWIRLGYGYGGTQKWIQHGKKFLKKSGT